MNIDWFTFVAQVFNFLVLVLLLRRFLYRPIVNAMAEREQEIQQRQQEAQDARAEANRQRDKYQDLVQEIQQQRDEMLHEARSEVQQARERMTAEARNEIERKRQEWREGLHREREDLLNEFQAEARTLSTNVARSVLQRLADAELEQQALQKFADEISNLGKEPRTQILQRLRAGNEGVVVRTAHPLSADWRRRLESIVRQTFDIDGDVNYEVSRDLLCGAELDVAGYTLGWNMDELLRDLTRGMADRLQGHTHA